MGLLRNENGSTLLMTVITIAVLTVLGTTVLSLTIMNYNMKYTDTLVKQTQYYSESGIEQVYSILGEYVDQALIYAKTETENDIDVKENEMSSYLEKVKSYETELLDPSTLIPLYETYYSDPDSVTISGFVNRKLYLLKEPTKVFGLNGTSEDFKRIVSIYSENDYYDGLFLNVIAKNISGDETSLHVYEYKNSNYTSNNNYTSLGDSVFYSVRIDEEAMDRYYNERMNYHFKKYFVDKFASDTSEIAQAITFDTDSDDVLDVDGMELDSISFDYEGSKNFVLEKGEDTLIIKNLKSTFIYHDRTRKTIQTDIVINAPTDMMPVKVNQSKYATIDNPLWQYGLVTEQVLTFDNVTSNITGNVYALGKKPDEEDIRNINLYEGINIIGDRTDVTIEGDVVSQSFVQMTNNASNANLTVKNGHIYCDSLATQAGTINNAITIENGNVYTKNDLVLNGKSNNINIQGNYYGYTNRDDDFYNVSAVIINADIEDSSRLTISGETPMHPKGVTESFDDKDGIVIAGTSFVNDIFTPNPNEKNQKLDEESQKANGLYETGESMGIAGNYLAYAFPEVDGSGNSVMGDPAIGTKSSLQLYYQKDENALSVFEKADYFMNNIIKDEVKGYINDGSGNININHKAYLHATGVVVGKEESGASSFKTHNKLSNLSNVEEVLLKEHVALLNYLEHYDEIGLSDISGYNGNIEEIINGMSETEVISNYSMIEQLNENINAVIENDDIREINGAKEVAIFQSEAEEDSLKHNILLVGEDSGVTQDDGNIVSLDEDDYFVINAIDGVMQGIILTDKKVRIMGKLDFSGSIIAKGNIYITGDGKEINIINNNLDVKNYLMKLIMDSPKLSYAFNPSSVNNSDFNDLGITLNTIETIKELSVSSGDINEMRKNYDEYIDLRNWRIVE